MQDHDTQTRASMLRSRGEPGAALFLEATPPAPATAAMAMPVVVAGWETLSLRGPAQTHAAEGLPS